LVTQYICRLITLQLGTFMTKLCNQAAIFFLSANAQPGLDTLPPPNHCFMLMRHETGVLYVNPSVNGVVTRFKFGGQGANVVRKSSPESPPRAESSLQYTIHPIFKHMWALQKISTLDRHPDNSPEALKIEAAREEIPVVFKNLHTVTLSDNKELKPKHYNVKPLYTHPHLGYQYYDLIRRYVRILKPTSVVDVGVYQYPSYQPLIYGRPMHCHNYLIHTLGLDIGNILTTRHFKDRLLNWGTKVGGATNFCSEVLFTRDLSESDYAQSSTWSAIDQKLQILGDN